MLAVILTLLIGGLCGIDLYLKSYIETHYKEGKKRRFLVTESQFEKCITKGWR